MRAGSGTTVPSGGRGGLFGTLRQRLGTGFRLAGRSAGVLRREPRLVAFPVVAGLGVGGFLAAVFGGLSVADGVGSTPATVGLLVAALGVPTFVTVLCNAALVHATREAFEGREPAIRRSFRAALARWPQLLAWALLSVVVGTVLRSVEESSGLAGQVVAGLLSLGWAALTYFVVPVIVLEDAPVTSMVQESGRLFRDTWGETVGTEFGVGAVTVLLVLPGALVGVVGYLLAGDTAGVVAAVALGAALALPGLLVGVTLGGVAKVALYRHARDGEAPPAFADLDLFG